MFFNQNYKRLDREESLVQHQGIFHRQISLFESVALIVGCTIGAGVLGIPFAVAKTGMAIGLLYIIILGLLTIGLNLLLGEITSKSETNMQLVGLSKKYLGRFGEWSMAVLVYFSGLGVLMVYIIGEGETLSALFGGSSFNWSLIFFAVGALFIFIGIRSIRIIDFVLSLGILGVVLVLAGISMPHLQPTYYQHFNLAYLLFPYGVVLFAYQGVSSIPEAYDAMRKRDKDFKKAIILAGLIVMVVYTIFSLIVVGVTGAETTEMATIGLGEKMGNSVLVFGNVFAFLAMGTSFLTIGLSLRDSLSWDHHLPSWLSFSIVTLVPIGLFVLGIRHFIAAIDVIGGVFGSLQMLLILLIYWQARRMGVFGKKKGWIKHTVLLLALLLVAFLVGAVYSVLKLF